MQRCNPVPVVAKLRFHGTRSWYSAQRSRLAKRPDPSGASRGWPSCWMSRAMCAGDGRKRHLGRSVAGRGDGDGVREGLQGDKRDLLATLKHYVGHSFSEGARNHAPVHLGFSELNDTFLLPFEMAVKLANAGSVMPAYHDIDNQPGTATISCSLPCCVNSGASTALSWRITAASACCTSTTEFLTIQRNRRRWRLTPGWTWNCRRMTARVIWRKR